MKAPRSRVPERERLRRIEARAAAEAEGRAVAEGVAETVALSRRRGAAITEPEAAGKRGAYRRQTGLDWLARKGRIEAKARAAGEHYGWAYRRAKLDPSIPSTLNLQPGGGQPGARSLEQVMAHGEGTAQALRRLTEMRRRLSGQPDLVAACDLVCGEEKTPREAAAGGERDAARLEAVLKVALDLLATSGGR